MAPVSQLHGMGMEEFSQTGPIDPITAIVNRSKTNVVRDKFLFNFRQGIVHKDLLISNLLPSLGRNYTSVNVSIS